MADNHTKEVRSKNMSHIRSKNTRPEELVRKALFALGFRYRKNVKNLPGKPDIVLPKYRAVIFVNGCFWHGHHDCKKATLPATNTEFWLKKISSNIIRDEKTYVELSGIGYKVLVVWQCELSIKEREITLDKLTKDIRLCDISSY